MTVVGLDDTDSRTEGMCTTYVAARIADQLREAGATVERRLLVRLNPAAPHKTRGNAALAVHTDADPERAFEVARETVAGAAVADDPATQPAVVVADHAPADAPSEVADFACAAVRELLPVDDAADLIDDAGYRVASWGGGRGRIGALAAVGAWTAGQSPPDENTDTSPVFGDWTYEHISYRQPDVRGTPRELDHDSLFAAAEAEYPAAWDTVDRGEGEAVCVPHTPGPILYGIRGDDPDAVRRVADGIDGEPVERTSLFVTNQGTDAHLRPGAVGAVADGRSYRVPGVVASAPETREGGHVFFDLADDIPAESNPEHHLPCAAFEPTKRFRDRVRALRRGDRVTVCGEVADGTLKLEKLAVRELVRTEPAVPECPDCGRSMESAGAGQGYRCRDCGTTADGKVEREVGRALEPGWYEVPPCARRHVAKPLVRGGFDGATHPEW